MHSSYRRQKPVLFGTRHQKKPVGSGWSAVGYRLDDWRQRVGKERFFPLECGWIWLEVVGGRLRKTDDYFISTNRNLLEARERSGVSCRFPYLHNSASALFISEECLLSYPNRILINKFSKTIRYKFIILFWNKFMADKKYFAIGIIIFEWQYKKVASSIIGKGYFFTKINGNNFNFFLKTSV